MIVNLNKKNYIVQSGEFIIDQPVEYNNLAVYPKVGEYERLASLLAELNFNKEFNLIITNPSHGAFIAFECSTHFKNIYLIQDNLNKNQIYNINSNIISHETSNIKWTTNVIFQDDDIISNAVIFSEKQFQMLNKLPLVNAPILVSPLNNEILNNSNTLYETIIQLNNSPYYVCIPNKHLTSFTNSFYYFITNNVLHYDNLIHLCIMVKNAGDGFENMLVENLPIIDRWTILDTGSTDNTIDIVNKVLVGKKKGELICEPFINFRDSRNRCLDLAGQVCKFVIMLDDTYISKINLRDFLHTIRGDQFADSYSMYIKSDDTQYVSNRIVKTDKRLRYIFKIHEIINDKNNINVVVPVDKAFIFDCMSSYMLDRTKTRKTDDLKLLMEEIDENPDISRHYYYVAQTYNFMKNYEMAHAFFLKRAYHPDEGFLQEKIDAFFEAARTAQFYLYKPWEECEKLYLKAYELDNSRPESLYFIGIYHLIEKNNSEVAYAHFKQAFKIGFPIHCQHSLKPTLSYHFLPRFLTELCYTFKDYVLGESVSSYFLSNNSETADYYNVIMSWYKIFIMLNKKIETSLYPLVTIKPYFCFVADGGFSCWSGSDILTKGVGGSETYIIEMARYIKKNGYFNVVVFCNCMETEIFEGVTYHPLNHYFMFLSENTIHTCIISRYSEYVPISLNSRIDNVHMVIHDLTPSGVVIPITSNLKKIFCLTEWHVEYLSGIFPQLKDRMVPFYYGIDFNNFKPTNVLNKIPYKFIYSSFPNRGLLQLLQMWPKIINIQPKSSLYIYSDINGKWVNTVEKEQMILIRNLLEDYKDQNVNIFYHGWVNKKELAEAWITSDVWLYPCTFKETFCLTALEAAITKTFVVCPDLAALNNTVGDRGLIVKGDATTEIWQNQTIHLLFEYLNNEKLKSELLEKNYQWAKTLSWEAQAEKLINQYIIPDI